MSNSSSPTREPSTAPADIEVASNVPTEEETRVALRGLIHGWQRNLPSAPPTASERMLIELDGWDDFARAFAMPPLRNLRIVGWPSVSENSVGDWATIAGLRHELTDLVSDMYKSFAPPGAEDAGDARMPRLRRMRIRRPHETGYSYIDRNGKMKTTYSKLKANRLRARGYSVQ